MAGTLPHQIHGENIAWSRGRADGRTLEARYDEIVRLCAERGISAVVPASELAIIQMEHSLAALGPAPRPVRERTQQQVEASILSEARAEFSSTVRRYEMAYDLAFTGWCHAVKIKSDAELELLGLLDPDMRVKPVSAADLLLEVFGFNQPDRVVSLKVPQFDSAEDYRLAAGAMLRHVHVLQGRIARTERLVEYATLPREKRTSVLVEALVGRILELTSRVDELHGELNNKKRRR
jgi:hypothetical protein